VPAPATIQRIDDTEHIATARRMKADRHTGKDIAKHLGLVARRFERYFNDDATAA
jgi:hypothetical protein